MLCIEKKEGMKMNMNMNKASMNDEQMDAVSGGTILPYSVQPGDTLAAIAARYHVSADDLARWNDIRNPEALKAGQQLKIKF